MTGHKFDELRDRLPVNVEDKLIQDFSGAKKVKDRENVRFTKLKRYLEDVVPTSKEDVPGGESSEVNDPISFLEVSRGLFSDKLQDLANSSEVVLLDVEDTTHGDILTLVESLVGKTVIILFR